LPVKPLGLTQLPGLVVLHCQIEGLLDVDLCHERGNLIQPFARRHELTQSAGQVKRVLPC